MKCEVDSEYIPSAEDLSQARDCVTRHEKRLLSINSQISYLSLSVNALRLQIDALQDLRSNTTTAMELQNAILAPIRRVIPEILGEIFFHFLTPWDPLDGCQPQTLDYAPWLLARVCRKWRRVAFGTPQLWTVVHTAYPMNLPLIIPSWIKRSGALTFQVFLEFPALLPQVQDPSFKLLLQALWGEFNRCSTLFLDLSPADYVRFGEFLNSGRQCLMPALRTLVVHSDQIERIGQLYTPNLHNLVIRTEQWHAIDLEPVRHALPIPLSHLVNLDLENISTTVDDVVNFLKASPGLINCKVVFDNLSHPTSTPPIALPHLQSLTLDWSQSDAAVTSFLCALHLPQLMSLSLHCTTPFGSLIDFGALIYQGKWAEISSLERITLRKLFITPHSSFLEFSKLYAGLQEIDVIGSTGTKAFVEALIREELAPGLRKLSLSLEVDVGFETVLLALRRNSLREFVLMSQDPISEEKQEVLKKQFPGDILAQAHVVSWSKTNALV